MSIKEKDTRAILIGAFKKYAIVLVLLLLIGTLSVLSPQFFKLENLKNILRQISVVTIMSFGVTFIILTGGIDLGLGAYVALASVISANIAKAGQPVAYALFAAIAVGVVCGMVNGHYRHISNPALYRNAGHDAGGARRGVVDIQRQAHQHAGRRLCVFWQRRFLRHPHAHHHHAHRFPAQHGIIELHALWRYAKAIGGNENAAKISGINTGFISFWSIRFRVFAAPSRPSCSPRASTPVSRASRQVMSWTPSPLPLSAVPASTAARARCGGADRLADNRLAQYRP